MTLAERVELVEACRQDAGLTVEELWLRCLSLGELHGALELEAYMSGALKPTRREYNLIALAMNEYFMDIGFPHPIPFIDG